MSSEVTERKQIMRRVRLPILETLIDVIPSIVEDAESRLQSLQDIIPAA